MHHDHPTFCLMRSLNKMVWEKGLKIVGALTLGALTLRAIRLVVVWSELLLMDPQVRKYKGDWALITGGAQECNVRMSNVE